VTIYHVGNVGDHHFIEMQLVDGESLYDRLKREGRLSVGEATRIVRDAAAAFAAVHTQNIVHRDIKPANIMLTREGQVKVMDFGLAKDVAAPAELTMAGHVMGTPYYMSPEQCEALELDGRSDVYSLGATYFHLLTGKFPFTGNSLYEIMRQHADALVPDLRHPFPSLPAAIQPVVEKAMAKRPEDRFQTMEEFAAALGQVQSTEGDDVPTEGTVATVPSAGAGAACGPPRGAAGRRVGPRTTRDGCAPASAFDWPARSRQAVPDAAAAVASSDPSAKPRRRSFRGHHTK